MPSTVRGIDRDGASVARRHQELEPSAYLLKLQHRGPEPQQRAVPPILGTRAEMQQEAPRAACTRQGIYRPPDRAAAAVMRTGESCRARQRLSGEGDELREWR